MGWVEHLLVLGAALGFATLDLLRKKLAARVSLLPLLFWLTAGVVPVFGAWFAVDRLPWPEVSYWLPAGVSVALNVGANLLYLRAVQVGELSRTIPLLSLTPVLTTLFAVPLLGEVPSLEQGLGIVLVVAGAVLLQWGTAPDARDRRFWRRFPESAWLMLAVATLWSATTPLDKLALRSGSVSFHGLFLHVGIATSVLIWLGMRGQTGRLGRAWGAPVLMLAALVASAVALGSQLLALERVLAALLETLKRGWGGLAALVFGALFFGERPTAGKATAVVIMVAGVGLLVL